MTATLRPFSRRAIFSSSLEPTAVVNQPMSITRLVARLVCLTLCFSSLASRADDSPKAKPDEKARNAEVAKLLTEARELYMADGSGEKADPRVLSYVWQREGINHSPLLHVAAGLAKCDDPKAAEAAQAIRKASVRIYALLMVVNVQWCRGHKALAETTLQQAIDLFKSKELAESRDALWPSLIKTLLNVNGDLAATRAAAEKIGFRWESMNAEERQYLLAEYHFGRGDVESARKALLELPPETFAVRKGQEALRNDDGANFYGWVSRSVVSPENYTADHVLLEWLHAGGQPPQVELILAHLKDSDPEKLLGYLLLTNRYQAAGDKKLAAQALEKAEALAALPGNQKSLEVPKITLKLAGLETEGKSPAQAIKESGVLEKYRGQAWLKFLILPLLKDGAIDAATKLAGDDKLDDQTHGYFAVALTKAKRPVEAAAHVKQATGLLGAPKILNGVALQLKKNGDAAAAKQTILDAITQAKKVKATIKWFPDEGEVRIQEKWLVMTGLYQTAIQLGQSDEVVRDFESEEASIGQVAQALGARGELETLRKWMASFNDSARHEGARCLALLGYAEGLAGTVE